MIKLKIDMNGMESVGDLLEFIEEVFIKRNWDLFLSLVLEIDNEQLIKLLNTKIIDQISQKIDIDIEAKGNNSELKSLLNKYRIGIFNPNNNQKFISVNNETNLESIDNLLLDTLDFEKQKGLIPTIVQDLDNIILMLAYSSRESLKRTIITRKAIYFSRSRNRLWIKGEQSGNTQIIKKIYYDCDADTLLFQVDQNGVACHTGSYSCFQNSRFSIPYLFNILRSRIQNANSTDSYTKRLSEDYDLLLAKIKEESLEVINYTDRNNLIWEIADLTYFILVLMATQKITPREIVNELRRRSK